MRPRAAAFPAVIFLGLLAGCGEPPRASPNDDGSKAIEEAAPGSRVQGWLVLLGSEDPTTRDQARAALLALVADLGASELAEIESSTRDPDPERGARAADVHRQVLLRRRLGTALRADLCDFETGRLEPDGTARPLLTCAAARWNGGSVGDEEVEALVEIVLGSGWKHGLNVEFMKAHRVRPFAGFFAGPEDVFPADRAEVLGWAGNPRRAGEIFDVLAHENAWVRTHAARALGRLGDPSAAQALMPLLESDFAPLRAAALWSLGELNADPGRDRLERALGDEEEEVRRAAADVVARGRVPGLAGPLEKAWERSGDLFRDDLLGSLAHLRAPDLRGVYRKELLRGDPSTRWVVEDAFVATTRPWHAKQIAEMIASGVEVAMDVAPTAVGRLEPAEARAEIATLLGDPRPAVRRAAVESLGYLRGPEAGDMAIAALADAAPEVRKCALWVLWRRNDPRLAAMCSKALDTPEMQDTALFFLSASGDMSGLDAIRSRLANPDPQIREKALEALRTLDAREALPQVRAALADRDEGVRNEAILTLLVWAGEADLPFLKAQAENGSHRDRGLATAELWLLGGEAERRRVEESVLHSGTFGLDSWDPRLVQLEPLVAAACLDALDLPWRDPTTLHLDLATLAEAAGLYWNEPERQDLLVRLKRLSSHPDPETRLSARFGRFFLEDTSVDVQREVFREYRSAPDPWKFNRRGVLKALAFANAREAYRDLGRAVRLTGEICGQDGFRRHLRERGFEVEGDRTGFRGRRAAGSWMVALRHLDWFDGEMAIEGRKIRIVESVDVVEYWEARLGR
ncbi:MAG: HEAT repeat domain-containing protein [Planctomycetes bacterium]|nr:HEAT repeat domain-containing protein [Planctomycetota bacterium]